MAFRVSPCLAVLLTLTAACGSGSDDDNGGSGTITGEWRNYCVATFAQDYQVLEFKEPLFTARAGEEYLISEYSATAATLIYLTPKGPYDFEVEPATGTQTLPFTTNCSESSTRYYAVFTDVNVYDSEDLSTKICDIPAGTVVPLDRTKMAGFSAAGTELTINGPTKYEIMLNAFSSSCGNKETGTISVPSIEIFGATTWLVPFEIIAGP